MIEETNHKSFMFLFLIVIVVYSYFSFSGWNGSLLEQHAFRQTQTAISVNYMLKGGDLLKYETPVLGPPWSIPMEFPTYQYLVYVFVKLTGYKLDQAGRFVSMIMFCSALYPFYILSKQLFVSRQSALIAFVILCISPQYIYWSRTFMIESTALATSVWYTYFIKRCCDDDYCFDSKYLTIIGMLILGVIASITKVTTFFVYYVVCIVLLICNVINNDISDFKNQYKRYIAVIILGFIVPLASIIIWTRYSDEIKSLNAFGEKLTSSYLRIQNFGTLDEKMSVTRWAKALNRSITDIIGDVKLMFLLPVFMLFCRKRTVITALILLILFFVPITVFTHLYFAHNYYFYANGILLILAIAIVIGDVILSGKIGYVASVIVLGLISVSCISHYVKAYLPVQGTTFRYQAMKADIDTHTRPNDVLVFFGCDWSSEMPYYLDRRALMFSTALSTPARYVQSLYNMQSYSVGAIIVCDGKVLDVREVLGQFGFSNEIKKVSYESCDAYYDKKREAQ